MCGTFIAMSARRMTRTKEGTIEYREARSIVLLLSAGMVFFGFANATAAHVTPVSAQHFDDRTYASIGLLGVLCPIAISLPHVSARSVVRALAIGLFASLFASACCSASPTPFCQRRSFYFVAVQGTGAVLVALIAKDGLRRLIFRNLASRNDQAAFLWSVRAHGDRQWTYRPELWVMFVPCGSEAIDRLLPPRRVVDYEGATDAEGAPHGQGRWFDSAHHGEILTGRWVHGRPVAPFRSYDYTTGYAFEAVCIGVVHDRAEPLHEVWYRVRHAPLRWSVCEAECSIAGKFYRHLPAVREVESAPSDAPTPAAWCLGRMPVLHHEASIPPGDSEVVIFVHGFNSPLSDAVARVGQLWTLGAFPRQLRPIVFGWPGSRDVCYFSAVRSVTSDRVVGDFEAVLENLRDAGVRVVHVLAHSLGARLLHCLLERGTRVFDGMQLRTVVLLNPDCALDDFVRGDYDRIAAVCDRITVYADHLDGALWYSEFFNRDAAFHRRRRVGRRPFDLVRARRVHDDEDAPRPWPSPLVAQITRSASDGAVLDLDVVDVSWMDHNMHDLRHSFFDINRLMVADICEVMATGRRARDRSALLHRHTNVFSFLNAPRHVVNR